MLHSKFWIIIFAVSWFVLCRFGEQPISHGEYRRGEQQWKHQKNCWLLANRSNNLAYFIFLAQSCGSWFYPRSSLLDLEPSGSLTLGISSVNPSTITRVYTKLYNLSRCYGWYWFVALDGYSMSSWIAESFSLLYVDSKPCSLLKYLIVLAPWYSLWNEIQRKRKGSLREKFVERRVFYSEKKLAEKRESKAFIHSKRYQPQGCTALFIS